MSVSDERELFVAGEAELLYDDMGEPVGVVDVRASETVTCWAEWGGWCWEAEGTTRANALRRLEARLMHLNPFDGADTDWGEPGHQLGSLDSRIPEAIRARMRALSDERGDVIPEDED